MTEKQWLKCQDAEELLGCLADQFNLDDVFEETTSRRLQLFACACVRRIWELLSDECRDFFSLVEQNAAKKVDRQKMRAAAQRAEQYPGAADTIIFALHYGDYALLGYSAAGLLASTTHQPDTPSHNRARQSEERYQGSLFHDIFANPFRQVKLARSWATPTVKRLAKAIYQDRTFDRLPILADALEEAGCTNADVLAHCRGPGPHVRGCWVLDRLTGRE